MQTTNDFIDAIKKRHSLPSDYAAAKLLNLKRQSLSRYRNKMDFFGDETAIRAAELLELQPGYVLACVAAERAKLGKVKKAWEAVAKKASAALLLVSIGSVPLSHLSHQVLRDTLHCILCQIRRRGWIAALLALFLINPAQAAETWTKGEIAAEAVYLTAHTIDWGQTRAIARDPEHYWEAVNPVLGRHPSVGRVNTWFAVMTLAQPLIANALPHGWRRVWIGAGMAIEIDMVDRNAAIGLKMAW